MYDTLKGVPLSKRVELPVMEEAQLGFSIGLALTGKTIISIYPRFDFLLCAMNQLVNHLDKLQDFTHGQYKAKVIVRVGIGSTNPLYPGVQHCGDYTVALNSMLDHVRVIKCTSPEHIMVGYDQAYQSKDSYIIVEDMNLYNKIKESKEVTINA